MNEQKIHTTHREKDTTLFLWENSEPRPTPTPSHLFWKISKTQTILKLKTNYKEIGGLQTMKVTACIVTQ